MSTTHIPVLLQEVLTYLQPEPNQSFIDGTVGQGGHAEALLERVLPEVRQTVRYLAIDRDASNLAVAKDRLSRFGASVVSVHDRYANVKACAYAHHFTAVDGILLDLGFSSIHVDDPSRGFSFRSDGPLDMRYDVSGGLTAADIVNTWSEDELARAFRQYGEETKARDVAKAIIARRKKRPFERTLELSECVQKVVPKRGQIHPATRVFQALRIAVNDELGELTRALPDLVDLLRPGGRLAIITFHSLEDRIVKTFMKERLDLRVLTRHAIKPSIMEVRENPRARSAKLRVAEKIS
ncbi:16S rRNA (cytosine(1402)-N(4))-methyltransferase RsmH [Candidatus Uhrbacteria bacterium]|nr:16S rRNA (cytosine(1402)-N(4))-methyltransferase RsmH [Candidatus Uhrbacteria bacterium]